MAIDWGKINPFTIAESRTQAMTRRAQELRATNTVLESQRLVKGLSTTTTTVEAPVALALLSEALKRQKIAEGNLVVGSSKEALH